MTIRIKIKNYTSLSIYKRERSPFYWVSFWVGKKLCKSGFYRKSLEETNQREAERKAKNVFDDFFKNQNKYFRKDSFDLEKDIFLPFIESRERKKKLNIKFQNISTNEICKKERQRFEKWIKPYFKSVDYNDVKEVNHIIEDIIGLMKQQSDIKDVTIVKYISLLSLMFRWAKDNDIIKILPSFPTLSSVSQQRPAYEPKEHKSILNRVREEYKKTEDTFFEWFEYYLNWVRSSSFRIGEETLNVKRFQLQFITHHLYEEQMLRVYLPMTKKKEHWLTVHPQFVKYVLPEIEKRKGHFDKGDDFLFFPHEKDRVKLSNRIRKNFQRISIELGLYMKNGISRPLTSLRHMNIQVARLKGENLDSIAERFNTSVSMLQKTYLKSGNEHYLKEKHFEMYKDFYNPKVKKNTK